MEKNESIVRYELVVIVDAKLNPEDRDGVVKDLADTITKSGAKVINNQVWLDKHKMTFAIKKCKEGTYYLINFEGETAATEKIQSLLKLNERILRYAMFRAEAKSASLAVK